MASVKNDLFTTKQNKLTSTNSTHGKGLHKKRTASEIVNESIITSVLIPTVVCFDKTFVKVKLNEAEMCSLVATCTQQNICKNLIACFSVSKNLIFLNGDKQCSDFGESSRKASCLKE